ncbi:dephospho-CoA kinase [Sphingomonas cavernae]|uniref:Dephospho-CoA kinase n=1 Tax=Sphingomonas cavernae TaxID=2320861 RepID=A0A418WRF3_9SPHN|nr:dephospho-CoA kinase [Sphingomonas cavernae]RJF93729.1 dephospho-CoA kinase [Sphingomonas cavernae]
MMVIGLTGSIGMGKSAVARMFAAEGVPVFDADAAVHGLQGPGGRLLESIEALFPGSTGPGGIDRAAIGQAVFGNPAALAALERIVHPAVAEERRAFLRRNRARPMVVLDIPLLFEKGGAGLVDLIVVASAPGWMQRRRVLARPGMTLEKFRRIDKLQTPDHVKRQRADVIVDTGVQKHETRAQIRHLVTCLRAQLRRY